MPRSTGWSKETREVAAYLTAQFKTTRIEWQDSGPAVETTWSDPWIPREVAIQGESVICRFDAPGLQNAHLEFRIDVARLATSYAGDEPKLIGDIFEIAYLAIDCAFAQYDDETPARIDIEEWYGPYY